MLHEFVKKHQVKLGFAPTRRQIFSKEEAGKFKKIIEAKLQSDQVEYVNLDFLNEEGMLYDGLDADKVAVKFMEAGVDALFVPHCNFGSEDAVAKLAKKLNQPVLVWGPQDDPPSPEGRRLRDTQCGLFATTKIMQRLGVPFTYITNCHIEDRIFANGFQNFLAVASVVKTFRNLRIGQISTRPGAFWSVMCNEAELLERFGIETVPITLVDIIKSLEAILNENKDELQETVAAIKNKIKNIGVNDRSLFKLAALKLAIKDWAVKEGLSAIGIQCWEAMQDALGIIPCFVNAELTDEGLPTVCETDIHGAVTSVITQAARLGETPTFFADLTVRHPDNPNAELLWHCGTFPFSLMKERGAASLTEKDGTVWPAAGNWEIKGGDITISRFDAAKGEYFLLMGHGKGVSGPKNQGTYVWVEFNDWPLWEHKFIYGPYIHHCTGIHGKVAPILYEACKYLPGLKADPVEPNQAEIEKIWRG
jgi:L-fucose isomerase-like protein